MSKIKNLSFPCHDGTVKNMSRVNNLLTQSPNQGRKSIPYFSLDSGLFSGGVAPSVGSYLDTRETFQHLPSISYRDDTFRAWKRKSYRIINLMLADKIDAYLKESINTADYVENYQVAYKIRKALRCCSSMSLLGSKNDSLSFVSGSKKCRHKLCPICGAAKAKKIENSLMDVIDDPMNNALFENKGWYMVTFTLRHKKGTRDGVYLSELKDNIKKLCRRNNWKKYIGSSKKDGFGSLASYELVISKDGTYHIHCHMMVVCPVIRKEVIKYEELQELLRDDWKSITKDSTGIHFQSSQQRGQTKEKFIREVVKYSVKVGDVSKLNNSKTSLLVQWVRETKGANSLNTSGILRGFGITSPSSKYDVKYLQKRMQILEKNQVDFQRLFTAKWLGIENKNAFLSLKIDLFKVLKIKKNSTDFEVANCLEKSIINTRLLLELAELKKENNRVEINDKINSFDEYYLGSTLKQIFNTDEIVIPSNTSIRDKKKRKEYNKELKIKFIEELHLKGFENFLNVTNCKSEALEFLQLELKEFEIIDGLISVKESIENLSKYEDDIVFENGISRYDKLTNAEFGVPAIAYPSSWDI